jgi:hypothetical protein
MPKSAPNLAGRGSREAAKFKQGNRRTPVDVLDWSYKRAEPWPSVATTAGAR